MGTGPSPRPLPQAPPPSPQHPHQPQLSRAQSPSHSLLPQPSVPSPSFSPQRRATANGRQTTTRLEPVLEGDPRFLVDVQQQQQQRPAPLLLSNDQVRRRGSSPGLARQRSKYFEQAFGESRDVAEQEDRVRGQAIVLADLKTNVVLIDEATFITDLASLLSKRYQRPLTSIAVTVQHSACLMFAGSFKPAYSLSIHALPSQIQTVTNKRNMLLLQAHLETTLRVPASRGVVRFVGVPEECMGSGGKTVAGVLAEIHERAGSSPTAESLDARVQRRKTLRTLSKLKYDTTSTANGTGPLPSPAPAGPRPEPPPPSSHVSVRQEADHEPQQTRVGSPAGDGGEQEQPQRSLSLRNKKSLHFLQSFFHKSTPNRS